MKTCPFCKKQLSDEASFCMYCMTQLVPITEIESKPKKETWKNVLICVLSILCLASTAGIIASLVHSQREADRYEKTISENEAVLLEQEECLKIIGDALTPSAEEEYFLLCEGLKTRMSIHAEYLGFKYMGCYDEKNVYSANTPKDLERHLLLQTHLSFCSGDVSIVYSRASDYVRCEIRNVPAETASVRYNAQDNAYRLMQVLFSTRTESTDTDLYNFVSNDEKYPLSEDNPVWVDFNTPQLYDDCAPYWYDSVVDENTKVIAKYKQGDVEDISVKLRIRQRQYGQSSFYDYLFEIYG